MKDNRGLDPVTMAEGGAPMPFSLQFTAWLSFWSFTRDLVLQFKNSVFASLKRRPVQILHMRKKIRSRQCLITSLKSTHDKWRPFKFYILKRGGCCIHPCHSQLLSVTPYPHPILSLHSMNVVSVCKNRISFAKENVMFPLANTMALCPYVQPFMWPAGSHCLL